MIRIAFDGGPVVEVEEGSTVLEASILHKIDHMHACRGQARCTTCRVEVLEGAANCPPPDAKESEVMDLNAICAPVRLACQLRPTGDVRVRVLLPETAGARVYQPRGREIDVAVLFADIRGFTTFAERRLPFDVLHVLTRYFDRMGTIIELHGGRVTSFQGDGMMALFGLGGDGDAAPAAAIAAALEMLDAVRAQAAYCSDHFDLDLQVGIGIDYGRAVVGKIGYYRNTQLNAIGDVVNTASRVQDLTKETGTQLLITQRALAHAGGRFATGREFDVAIRGKSGEHRVYEVLAAQ